MSPDTNTSSSTKAKPQLEERDGYTVNHWVWAVNGRVRRDCEKGTTKTGDLIETYCGKFFIKKPRKRGSRIVPCPLCPLAEEQRINEINGYMRRQFENKGGGLVQFTLDPDNKTGRPTAKD